MLATMLAALIAAPPAPIPELVVQSGNLNAAKPVAYHPNGTRILTGSSEKLVVWDVRTGKMIRVIAAHTNFISALAAPPGGGTAFTGSADKTVKEWEIATGRLLRTLEAPAAPALALAPKMLAGGNASRIYVWDLATGAVIHKLEEIFGTVYHSEVALGFSPDGAWFATCHTDTTKIYDTRSWTLARELKGLTKPFAWSPDGAWLVLADDHLRRLRKVDARTFAPGATLGPYRDLVNEIAISPDSKELAVYGDPGGGSVLDVYDLATTKRRHRFKTRIFTTPEFSPDGRFVLAGGVDRKATLWDLESGRLAKTFTGRAEPLELAAFSPDGRYLILAHDDWDDEGRVGRETGLHRDRSRVMFIDLVEHRTIGGLRAPIDRVTDAAWNAAGDAVAFAHVDSNTIWSFPGGDPLGEVKQWKGEGIHGEKVPLETVEVRGETILLRPPLSRVAWRELAGEDRSPKAYTVGAATSPDKKRRAFAVVDGDKRTVEVWDVESRRRLLEIESPPGLRTLTFDRSGRRLAVATDEVTRVHDPENGKILLTVPDGGYRISFSADDSLLYLLHGDDNRMTAWRVPAAELHYTAAFIGSDRVLMIPGGWYTAPKSVVSGLAFRIGDQIYPFDQFDLRFNRPDKVYRHLGAPEDLVNALSRAVQKRLATMGFTEESLQGDLLLPEVQITTEKIPAATAKKELELSIRAKDPAAPLDRVNLYVNGVPVHGRGGISVREAASRTLERSLKIELGAGANRIEVSVTNARGLESLRETVEVTYTGRAEKPALLVLSIGVSKYRDGAYDLEYAAKDAKDVAAHFSGRKGSSFSRVETKLLTDAQVGREALRDARALLEKTRVDDQVVVFLAGHGLLDERLDYYFATSDVDFSAPAERGIRYEELDALLDGIPARRKLMLIDTCHSGELDPEALAVAAPAAQGGLQVKARAVGTRGIAKKGGSAASKRRLYDDVLRELFADLRRGTGARVISSAGGAELALESGAWKNGVFTYALLRGLKEKTADRDKDGVVFTSELHEAVAETVVSLTAGRQRPTVRQGGVELDFAVP